MALNRQGSSGSSDITLLPFVLEQHGTEAHSSPPDSPLFNAIQEEEPWLCVVTDSHRTHPFQLSLLARMQGHIFKGYIPLNCSLVNVRL